MIPAPPPTPPPSSPPTPPTPLPPLAATPAAAASPGASFRSYRDGRMLHLSPESTVRSQKALGADIIIPLDDLPGAATAATSRSRRLGHRPRPVHDTSRRRCDRRGAARGVRGANAPLGGTQPARASGRRAAAGHVPDTSPTRPRHVPDTSPTRPRHVPDIWAACGSRPCTGSFMAARTSARQQAEEPGRVPRHVLDQSAMGGA